MLFALMSEDVKESLVLRQSVRAQHLARLQQLQDQGRLIVAGPFPINEAAEFSGEGFSGSLIVAEFDDYIEAKQWADADPYVSAGVFKKTTIKAFKLVLPK